jgi:anti-sigma factor RsiW
MNALTDADRLAVMAYVDGELPPADAAAFDARLALEPVLASAVARERTLRARLRSAYAPVLDEEVPAGLLDLLAVPGPGLVAPTLAANEALPAGANDAARARLPHASRWQWPQWSAMAACLVLGLALGARVLAPHPNAGGSDALALAVGSDGAITAQGALRDALEQHVAGAVLDPNSPVAVGLTFRNHARAYCRTFTLDNASSGIACKRADGWVVASLEHSPATAAAAPASAAGGYRMAASPFSPTLLQAVDAMREGDTLDAAAETAARAKGWKP